MSGNVGSHHQTESGKQGIGSGPEFGRKNILTQREVGLQYWIVVTCFQGDKGETRQITGGVG
jgi:hypothetical protein